MHYQPLQTKPAVFKSAAQLNTLLSASIFVLAWILLAAQSVSQQVNVPTIEQRVAEKIQQSGKGVILGIATHDEDVTALADKLLTEVESNRYYAPVFITAKGLGFQQQLTHLGLTSNQLPAVIYFNQQGHVISRSVKVGSTNVGSANVSYQANRAKGNGLFARQNADYLVALSQALSSL